MPVYSPQLPQRAARRDLDGQAYVEFALCAVVLLMLIFTIVNFSFAIYAYNFVSYAAREGTRYAAVRGSANSTPASTSDVSNFVLAEAYGLRSDNLTVTTTWNPNNSPGSVVKVQVQYSLTLIVPFMQLAPLSLTSTSQMVISH